jgi:hypothetical protein
MAVIDLYLTVVLISLLFAAIVYAGVTIRYLYSLTAELEQWFKKRSK